MNQQVLKRYTPFLALAALQLLLVTLAPPRATSVDGAVAAGGPGASGFEGGSFEGGGAATPGGGSSSSSGGAAGASGGQAGGVGGPGGGPGGAGGTQFAGGQKYDSLGRPLSGDRSKCAPGGILQEKITLQSPPCMPINKGGNPGATWQGVTAKTIKVVVFYPEYEQGTQQVLAANGLAMTPAQAKELHEILARFFNSHYEFHGRKLEVVEHISPAADPIELRAEAKAINQKHKPFAVLYYAQGLMPLALADELSRAQILTLGALPTADEFFIDRAPFVWSQVIQGYRFQDIAADYWCKKLRGKNATLAGDPALQTQPRKLGVGSSEDPSQLAMFKYFIKQITGGRCGSPKDPVTLYTYSADPDTAEAQRPALISRMKNDGITTTYRLNPCAEGDDQQYFPENFTSEVFDDDFVGRVYGALCGPTQMRQVFGIGMFPKASPESEKEFYKATQSVVPGYDPPYLAEGPFQGLAFLARLIQYAGPNLTPANVYRGAQTTPQIGGWTKPHPMWTGWQCCNPLTPEYHIGISPTSFTAKTDARQIYWDGTAVSGSDGATGSWVGVDNSRRYRAGQWPPGEPRQP